MQYNARDEERGKRQVRSLECLQIAKKIGRLLSFDAWLGMRWLCLRSSSGERREGWKKKYPRDSSGWLLNKIRGDSIEKSGRDENHLPLIGRRTIVNRKPVEILRWTEITNTRKIIIFFLPNRFQILFNLVFLNGVKVFNKNIRND